MAHPEINVEEVPEIPKQSFPELTFSCKNRIYNWNALSDFSGSYFEHTVDHVKDDAYTVNAYIVDFPGGDGKPVVCYAYPHLGGHGHTNFFGIRSVDIEKIKTLTTLDEIVSLLKMEGFGFLVIDSSSPVWGCQWHWVMVQDERDYVFYRLYALVDESDKVIAMQIFNSDDIVNEKE